MAKAIKKQNPKEEDKTTKFRWIFVYKCDRNLTLETQLEVEDEDIASAVDQSYQGEFFGFSIGKCRYLLKTEEIKLIVRSVVPVDDVLPNPESV